MFVELACESGTSAVLRGRENSQAILLELNSSVFNCAETTQHNGQKGLDYSHLLGNVDISDYLDLIFSTAIERHLEATIVTDFPACQAALAETKSNNAGELVASRFECFLGGIELANGYFELRDTDEILNRLGQNNLYRRRNDLPHVPIDEMAVTAMGEMNPCSGVAVGIDRLVMYLSGETNITRVINFAGDHRLD